HPDERAVRVRQPPGRHVRTGRVRVLRARLPDAPLERQVGRPACCSPELDHVRRPLPARPGAGRPASRRPAALGYARLRVGRVFWDRTLGWQSGRDSPFSLWDWRQYHAGLPDLHVVQWVLEGLLVVGAIAAYFLPRRKSPLQLAALTAALLIGFELVLTHWFYLYIPWFFPFAAFAFLAPARAAAPRAEPPAEREHEVRELVPAG